MSVDDHRVSTWRPSSGLLWLAIALPSIVLTSLVGLQMLWSQQADRRAASAPAEAAAEVPAEAAPAEQAPAPAAETAPQASAEAAAGEFAAEVGGAELRGAAGGVEAKLIAFIESGAEPCTAPECWFTFDRLTFQTGSAEIDMERSAAQIENIHRILQAYPSVQLKIGGYTDNTGADAGNLALSQARAEAVAAAVAALGSDPARLDAEGYGSQFPVASNDSEEGRARNRRIDVRVRAR